MIYKPRLVYTAAFFSEKSRVFSWTRSRPDFRLRANKRRVALYLIDFGFFFIHFLISLLTLENNILVQKFDQFEHPRYKIETPKNSKIVHLIFDCNIQIFTRKNCSDMERDFAISNSKSFMYFTYSTLINLMKTRDHKLRDLYYKTQKYV